MMRSRVNGLTVIVFAAILVGCNALPRMGAVPDRFAVRAVLTGLDDVRYVVGDEHDMQRLAQDMVNTWPRERTRLSAQSKPIKNYHPATSWRCLAAAMALLVQACSTVGRPVARDPSFCSSQVSAPVL